jgi:hypothetical protein
VPNATPYGEFTKTIDGRKYRRIAYTPAQAVKFKFDGWVEVPPKRMPKPATPAGPAPQTS